MSFEFWIVLLLVTAGLSAWIGFTLARRNGPSQAEMDALEAELDEARTHADAVQANVSEHFEQSAVLFGRLANDYREFLDHFSSSAQTLGLSETRARELLEQGLQPVLTHQTDEVVASEAAVSEAAVSEEKAASEEPAMSDETVIAEETEEVALTRDEVVDDEVPVLEEPVTEAEPESTGSVADVVVEMPEVPSEEDPAVKQANP